MVSALICAVRRTSSSEVDFDGGDNRLTVRNRLEAAAQRHGLYLAFRRTSGRIERFDTKAAPPMSTPVEEPLPPAAPKPAPEPAPAPKKRGRGLATTAA